MRKKNINTVLYIAAFSREITFGMLSIAISLFAIAIGADSLKLGGLGFVTALFYTLFCPPFGRLSDRTGYKRILFLGCLTSSLLCLLLSFSTRLYQLFLLLALMGISGAMFWPSLIAWLAGGNGEESLLEKLTRFNIIWCVGAAIGPLIAGVLFQLNSRLPFYLAVFVSFIIVLLILSKPYEISKETHFMPEHVRLKKIDCDPQRKLYSRPASSYVYVAWIANFTAFFSIGIIRYLFPRLSTEIGFQPSILGILISLIAVSQGFTFYLLGRSSRWHYQLMFLIYFQLLEIIGLIIIFLSNSLFLFVVAFMLIGAGAGMTYFSSIFYSLNICRNRATKSSVHEAMVGGGGLVGPLVGGILGQVYTLKTPYLAAMFVISSGIIAETLLMRGKK